MHGLKMVVVLNFNGDKFSVATKFVAEKSRQQLC